MPNKHAAEKDLRKSRKANVRNARAKTNIKALTHQLSALIKEGKAAETKELVKKLQQAVAKASKNHVFHANKSNRKISAAHRSLNVKK